VSELPVTQDRAPLDSDNPRHAVWVDDERGTRLVTARNPGEERISLNGVLYTHTRETTGSGRWVFTK